MPRRKRDGLPSCVYKKHGAYYYVRNNHWEPLGRDLPTALERYGRRITGRAGSMAKLIDKVIAHTAPQHSETTRRQYRQIADKLKDIFLEFDPADVDQAHIARIKVKFADRPFWANRLLSVLRLVFAHAVEWQIVRHNPVIGLRRHTERKRTRYVTDAEFTAIRAQAGPRLKVIMDLCYLTGQRIGDILRIRYSDLTTDGIAFRQGKTGARLIVQWNPDLEAAVASAKALTNIVSMTYLLPARDRKKPVDYRSVSDQWRAAVKAAGIADIHIHDLRAKAGTDAKRQGHDPQALLGHTSPQMTARYIRAREIPLVTGPKSAKS